MAVRGGASMVGLGPPAFGVVQAEFPVPEWMRELQVEFAHAWALELNELDPDVRDAVLEVQADMGWPF